MEMEQTMSNSEAPPGQLPVSRLMDGYLITQLLYVAVKLNIADFLVDEPQTAGALAQSTGVNPDILQRVLRGLAAEGVLDEHGDGRFGVADLGTCLRSDAPGSLRGAIIARGDLYYRAAAGLFDAVRDGGVPFERIYGCSFFEHLAQHPESGNAFQASQEARVRHEAAAVVAAYDFTGFERLVDIGGGHGVMLAAILAGTPGLRGTLLDLEPVAKRARQTLEAAGLLDRCDLVAGDFFDTVPAGGDAYLLSRVLHNWDDEAAFAILRRCREAMRPDGSLLLVEVVLPERASKASDATRMDLHMLTLLGGRERTAAEFERLLAQAGFRIRRVVPTLSTADISVIEAG
jgi:predicted O-methyltransferase YrrM